MLEVEFLETGYMAVVDRDTGRPSQLESNLVKAVLVDSFAPAVDSEVHAADEPAMLD